jgi:hypothetical protein
MSHTKLIHKHKAIEKQLLQNGHNVYPQTQVGNQLQMGLSVLVSTISGRVLSLLFMSLPPCPKDP